VTSRIRVAQGLLVTDGAVLFCYGALSLLFVPGLPGQPYLIVAPKGEMLRKGFSAVVAAARCGKKSAFVQRLTCVCGSFDKGRHAAATNRSARHSMSEDRASGGMHFASKRILRFRLEMAKKTPL
jgi:hypothetical protein